MMVVIYVMILMHVMMDKMVNVFILKKIMIVMETVL